MVVHVLENIGSVNGLQHVILTLTLSLTAPDERPDAIERASRKILGGDLWCVWLIRLVVLGSISASLRAAPATP